MTFPRIFPVLASALLLAACGGSWPDLAPDPAQTAADAQPDRPPESDGKTESLDRPTETAEAAADETTLARAIAALRSRLSQYQNNFADLSGRIEKDKAAITPQEATDAESWATAQLRLSRLSVRRGDLSRLFRSAEADAARILRLQAAVARRDDKDGAGEKNVERLNTLGRDIAGFLERVGMRQIRFKMDLARLNAELAAVRPAQVREAPDDTADLPAGEPVLALTAEAEPARYRDAVATLVDQAEKTRPEGVYRVVAARDSEAQEKGRAVLSLLGHFGVAAERRDAAVDLKAEAGTLRVFVE